MKTKLAAMIAVALFAAAALGSAQSLEELAKKEKERREKLKAESKVITDKDTARNSRDAAALTQPPEGRQRVGLEGKSWSVSFSLPGFETSTNTVKAEGRRYFYATNRKTGVNVSLTLEATRQTATKEGCRQYQQKVAKGNASVASDVEFSDSERFSFLGFTLREVQGHPLNQRYLRACAPREDVYVDFNFSKVQFAPGEEKLFMAILDTARFEDVPEPPRGASALDLWLEGSALFRDRNYRGAIGPYAKALELEKKERKLERNYWYALIDNLGMAYGISGNLKDAKATFEYGISQDPQYPLFHYNMACTYAELNDKVNAMEQLTKAFELRANAIPGEKMPDPRKDDSFARFMKDPEFSALAERLAKSAQ
ncbi:MAG: hypothetical protein DMG09_09495 [Acidobacteria bacterium]|nr:MAG: hypothetical protein DMG09_09495 [Acidobacteriota bacterium]